LEQEGPEAQGQEQGQQEGLGEIEDAGLEARAAFGGGGHWRPCGRRAARRAQAPPRPRPGGWSAGFLSGQGVKPSGRLVGERSAPQGCAVSATPAANNREASHLPL